MLAMALGFMSSVNAQETGNVVMAKGGSHPLLIWDCTPALAEMVRNKVPGNTALSTLESQAMHIAGQRAGSLPQAKTITVRVLYEKIGSINPAYGTPTFTGIERVFDLSADAKVAKRQSDAFAKDLARGTTPKGVTVTQTGKLPPM